jgi:hypothetical protein
MWLAVCSDKNCQWEYHAASRALAQHIFERHVLESDHRGAVVELEAEREAEVDRLNRAA